MLQPNASLITLLLIPLIAFSEPFENSYQKPKIYNEPCIPSIEDMEDTLEQRSQELLAKSQIYASPWIDILVKIHTFSNFTVRT